MNHQLATQTKRGLKTTCWLSGLEDAEEAPGWDPDTDMRTFLVLASLLAICSLSLGQGSVPLLLANPNAMVGKIF